VKQDGVYGGNYGIAIIKETYIMYKVSVGIHFVSEGQIIQLSTILICHAQTAKNLSLFVSVELDNGHCDALLRVAKKEVYTISPKVPGY
jgi:hypothetical protein